SNSYCPKKSGKSVALQSKMAQSAEMLNALAARFVTTPVWVVAESWFGNNGLFGPLAQSEFEFRLLSRLRSNTTRYDLQPSAQRRPAVTAII
ncbi:MAG: hypothetical protein ACRERS_05445, partial [Methylococcales bacterium]